MDYHVIPRWARDAPSDKDLLYSELWGDDITTELPERVFLAEGVKIYNQWAKKYTRMACGSYWLVHGTNIHNHLNVEGSEMDPYNHWGAFVNAHKKPWYDPITMGSSLQDQLNFGILQGLIKAYTRLEKTKKQEYQINLANKRCVYSGSSNIDREKTKKSKDKFAVIWPGAGHIFLICGYGPKGLVCMNSYWPLYMDNWFFYVRREDTHALFSCYSLFDQKDYRTMEQWRKIIKQKQMERAA